MNDKFLIEEAEMNKNLMDAPLTDYQSGYNDGIEAAARVCDSHAKLYAIWCIPSAESAAINLTKAIRKLKGGE